MVSFKDCWLACVAEFVSQRRQVLFHALGVSENEARHEAKKWIRDFTALRNRYGAGCVASRGDVDLPSSAEHLAGVAHFADEPLRPAYFGVFKFQLHAVFICFKPDGMSIAVRQLFDGLQPRPPLWVFYMIVDRKPYDLLRLADSRHHRRYVFARQHSAGGKDGDDNGDQRDDDDNDPPH